MDRYSEIRSNILYMAEKNDDIKAVIEIGSQTRSTVKADEYSDLDVLILTDSPEAFLDDDKILSKIGEIKISFAEPTFGGGKERRILFDGSLDVDFIVLTQAQFDELIRNHFVDVIFARGYKVIYDIAYAAERLSGIECDKVYYELMSESEYNNLVNDFWFHTVWAAKKICRGELWTAKMCIDAYLKGYLMKIAEHYHICKYGEKYDVWHNGRMVEKWADEEIKDKLTRCFAKYDAKDMADALKNTAELFGMMARAYAQKKGVSYPFEAEAYASMLVKSLL